ncbi:MAG: hypothetical protein LBJ73_01395 [Rickettsiales bacterium]|jgi:hypothetical protein|nr:hypothetical protein [Rickettsiales bacterium]
MQIITEDLHLSDDKVVLALQTQCFTPFPYLGNNAYQQYPYQIDWEFRGTKLNQITKGLVEAARQHSYWRITPINPIPYNIAKKISDKNGFQVRAFYHAGCLRGDMFDWWCSVDAADADKRKELIRLCGPFDEKTRTISPLRGFRKAIRNEPIKIGWDVDTVEGLVYLSNELRKYFSR